MYRRELFHRLCALLGVAGLCAVAGVHLFLGVEICMGVSWPIAVCADIRAQIPQAVETCPTPAVYSSPDKGVNYRLAAILHMLAF